MFCFVFYSESCLPNITYFSGLSILDLFSSILSNIYLTVDNKWNIWLSYTNIFNKAFLLEYKHCSAVVVLSTVNIYKLSTTLTGSSLNKHITRCICTYIRLLFTRFAASRSVPSPGPRQHIGLDSMILMLCLLFPWICHIFPCSTLFFSANKTWNVEYLLNSIRSFICNRHGHVCWF